MTGDTRAMTHAPRHRGRRRWDEGAGREAAERLARGGALAEVLDTGDPAAWIALDQAVRGLPHPDGALPALLRARPETALCHAEGRIREEALPAHGQDGSLLPLVVIRCADWIQPVRTRARALLERALAEHPGRTLGALTPLVLRLGARERGAWARELFEAALREAPAGVLEELLRGGDPAARRFAGGLLLESARPGAVELARRAAREGDAVLRRLWTDAALAALAAEVERAPYAGTDARASTGRAEDGAGAGPDAVVDLLLGARSGQVRAAGAPCAGDAVTGRDGAGGSAEAGAGADLVVDLLLGARSGQVRAAGVTALRRLGRAAEAGDHLADRVAVVRACARWLVGQDGGDPHARYRELCAAPATLTGGAVLGLAECGRRTDAPVLRALLSHPRPGVRAGAVAGLRLLDAADADAAWPLLADPSGAVVREAALALRPSADRLPEARLTGLLGPGAPLAQRRAAHRLLHARGGVAALRASVALLEDPDPGLRGRAEQCLQALWSPYAPPPLPARDPEVDALLARCTGVFSDHVLRRMRARLGFATP
ncbi:hypothetical protein ABZY31_19415 [Streptomyces sp. NPDC006529]|uniref:hypothetical protein n=1 Tax=Streptomyces sp. NPDC006529 TaxID=3157177 RepID=UPI0033A8ADF0